MPVARLWARLVSMAAGLGIPVVAVDLAYTGKWGAQRWQQPLTGKTRKTTRHDAAAVAIGRRALGHPVRRRTAPPPHDRSDRAGHRTVRARPGIPGREGTRPRVPGPRIRSVPPGRGANAGDQGTQHRSGRPAEHEFWQQDSLPLGMRRVRWKTSKKTSAGRTPRRAAALVIVACISRCPWKPTRATDTVWLSLEISITSGSRNSFHVQMKKSHVFAPSMWATSTISRGAGALLVRAALFRRRRTPSCRQHPVPPGESDGSRCAPQSNRFDESRRSASTGEGKGGA